MAEVSQTCSKGIEECAQNESRSFVLSRPVRRLALLSPWSGGNLGNTTILSSVILNISNRIPAVEFVGITLSLEQTRRRYGFEAFPLAAGSRLHYYQDSPSSSQTREGKARGSGRIKQWLKRIPLLVILVKTVRMWSRELAHIAAATRVVRRLDAVIIPGGGALDEFWGGPWGHPWSLLKWSVLSRIYRVPFLFVSVGKCSLEHPLSRFFVRIALRLAAYRSYRDPDFEDRRPSFDQRVQRSRVSRFGL